MTIHAFANRKPPSIRLAMVAVAIVGAVFGLVANERWRWGYPRRLAFDRRTALAKLSTAALGDFRMYDGYDVDAVMKFVVAERLLVGKSKGQIVELLGPVDGWRPVGLASDPNTLSFSVGTVPFTMHAGPPVLCCRFDDAGKCVDVAAFSSW